LAALLAHRQNGDPVNDAILACLFGAIGDAMERLGVVAFGDVGIPAGRALNDPSVAPEWALAHAAQYTGAQPPKRRAGEGEVAYLARARTDVVTPFGIRRGTHEAIRRAAEPYLTGEKTVLITDAAGEDEYSLLVRTKSSETPDTAALVAALVGSYVSSGQPGAIRAELVLTYGTTDFVAWQETTRSWAGVAAGVTWSNVTRGGVT